MIYYRLLDSLFQGYLACRYTAEIYTTVAISAKLIIRFLNQFQTTWFYSVQHHSVLASWNSSVRGTLKNLERLLDGFFVKTMLCWKHLHRRRLKNCKLNFFKTFTLNLSVLRLKSTYAQKNCKKVQSTRNIFLIQWTKRNSGTSLKLLGDNNNAGALNCNKKMQQSFFTNWNKWLDFRFADFE